MSLVSRMLREAMVDAAIITGFWAAATAASARAHQARTSPTHLFVAAHEPAPPAPDATELRVCADPNNLPFSNAREQGFENDIATLAAHDLDRHVRYYWQPQRRGFIRTTLNAGWCDVVMGVPARYEMAKPTRPYYRSTYVFVSRRGAGRRIASLDDPRLRRLRIGVEMTGDDYSNPPALQALASRRIIDNVHGYLVFGDYSTPDPPRAIVDAVARGEVDTAIAWGPLAGYFASRSRVPLDLVPVTPERDGAGVVFTFDIAMATRRGDRVLNDALNRIIANRSREIRAILDRFRIPLVETGAQS